MVEQKEADTTVRIYTKDRHLLEAWGREQSAKLNRRLSTSDVIRLLIATAIEIGSEDTP